MNPKELDSIRNRVLQLLAKQRLNEAFNVLGNAAESMMFFEINDELKQLRQTYAYMLGYLTSGSQDPGRKELLNDLIAQTYRLLDIFVCSAREREASTLNYNIRRYRMRQKGVSSIAASVERWKDAFKEATSISSLYADAMQGDSERRTKLESAETELFNSIWTSYPLTKEERKILTDLICSPETPTIAAVRFTSAFVLALLEFADGEAVFALCDIYTCFAGADNEKALKLRAVAVTGLIMGLYKYRGIRFNQSTVSRLRALTDIKTWGRDVRLAFMEIVRSRDTERINRTMQNEIIPGMLSLRPEIEKKIKDLESDSINRGFTGDNPEWEEMLMNSELGEKLKKLNDMQMEGSDLYMSTFANLKNFPFFNEVVNWFTPITPDNPFVDKIITASPELSDLVGVIQDLPFLCDSDKYSMLFSIGMIPAEQLKGMLNHLQANREHLQELKLDAEGLKDSGTSKMEIRNFLHNFYRFVKLFRRKSEFYNIFEGEINLLEVDFLRDSLEDVDLLKLVSEFYFRNHYYNESLTAFHTLDTLGEIDATLYQKMGFAYQQLNDLDNAIKYYEQAELLDGNSMWVKLQMSNLYRKSGNYRKSLDILKSLENDNPEDGEIALQAGYTYIAAENYREALRSLYKAEFLAPDNIKILRPIAWSLFMIRDFDKASVYYRKIISIKAQPEDYLNLGHVEVAKSNYKEAVNYYKTYISTENIDIDKFYAMIDKERKYMRHAGIKDDIISLVADALVNEIINFNSK